MLSYERELAELNAPPELIAIERREIFSVHNEVRAVAWGGAMLVASGVAILVSKNLDRIGPVTLAIAIAVAALLCYAAAVWRRASARRSILDEYIILLGALLISVDAAYIESQFHLLQAGWPRHFLILAVLHGIAAYYFDSRAVLTLSIAALASWLGAESRAATLFSGTVDTGWRALLASGVVVAWRAIDLRLRRSRSFERVFEHAAANLALIGSVVLTLHASSRWIGLLLTLIAAGAVIRLGFQRRSEPFIIYAYAYAVIAIDVAVTHLLRREDVLIALYFVTSSIVAIVGLFLLHSAFRRRA